MPSAILFTFVNENEEPLPDPVDYGIEATKKLTGRTLKAGEFEFELLDANTGDVIDTATNDENGKIKFNSITYDKVGRYNYKIREVVGNDKNITYDDKVRDVTVIVTKDGYQLVAELLSNIEFTNKYNSDKDDPNNNNDGNNDSSKKPTNGGPHTGDNSNLLLFMVVLIIAAAAVVGVIVYRKRQ